MEEVRKREEYGWTIGLTNVHNNFWGNWKGRMINSYYHVAKVKKGCRLKIYLENRNGPEIELDWFTVNLVK